MENWIIGNWKMNGSRAMINEVVPGLLEGLSRSSQGENTRMVICPPSAYLSLVRTIVDGTPLGLGAQRIYPKPSGAFTGEISAEMLVDLGVEFCIIGHSEQRQLFGVTNAMVTSKLHALLTAGIRPILCVGETLEERESGRAEAVIGGQLEAAFGEWAGGTAGKRMSDPPLDANPALDTEQLGRVIIAYEPVWAIGTGKTATPEQANQMHGFIRGALKKHYNEESAQNTPILYGGSVNAENAGELLGQSDINGALVGGASLKAGTFLDIFNQAPN